MITKIVLQEQNLKPMLKDRHFHKNKQNVKIIFKTSGKPKQKQKLIIITEDGGGGMIIEQQLLQN